MKKLLFFCLVCLISKGAFAQTEDELPINDSLYATIESSNMNLYGGSKGDISAKLSVVSLRKYCSFPALAPQAINGVNWAKAIAQTMSIQYAYTKGLSLNQMSQQAFSPYFLYDLLPKAAPKSCKLNQNWIAETKRLLENTGTTTIAQYSYTTADCNRRPSSQQINQVKRYSVRSFNRIFEVNLTNEGITKEGKIFGIKRCLDRNHPVVVCLIADDNFQNLRSHIWAPTTNSEGRLQSAVVVGYDETRQMFEVMGTQGMTWGNQGFAWVRYDNVDMVKYGFEIIMNTNASPSPAIVKVPKPHKTPQTNQPPVYDPPKPIIPDEDVTLSGSLILNDVIGYDTYRPTALERMASGYYEPAKLYPVDTQFQLVAQQAQTGSYVYVFSVDPKGKAEIHYPYQWNSEQKETYGLGVRNLSPTVPEEKSQVIIPLPRINIDQNGNATQILRALTKEVKGTDWLVVLFSDRRLEAELNELVAQLHQHNRDFMPRFNQTFGDRLVEAKNITYTDSGFKANTRKGYIVPMIIKMEGN